MEKGRNSYYGLAVSDLMYAKNSLDFAKQYNDFNGVASLCAQSSEKFLKSFIEVNCFSSNVEIMKTHNLRKLVNEVNYVAENSSLSSRDYKWLGDFYFDTRNPGEFFVIVSEQDAIECIRLTETLKLWVDNNDNSAKRVKSNLKNSDSFSL